MFAVQADFGKSESPKILKVKQAVERHSASSPGRALMASFLLLESILDESAVVQATWISERRLRNSSRSDPHVVRSFAGFLTMGGLLGILFPPRNKEATATKSSAIIGKSKHPIELSAADLKDEADALLEAQVLSNRPNRPSVSNRPSPIQSAQSAQLPDQP